ncbi:hypothetical protein AsAng_0031330 [Aureispira anguillae]|uniref:Uncharacterized protein n=1 Tax=Aureispira anguillae TaxID=2864201 RepID=A0A915YG42_9BACT|nr:hypothetical protein AsAng_0031330 [Aureispira anguillae]
MINHLCSDSFYLLIHPNSPFLQELFGWIFNFYLKKVNQLI